MATRIAPRSSTFAFDLKKPLKQGFLLKQGQLHRAFKNRFFVLYPGFLVYYADQNKWKFDLTKGETLGSRIGAIKLKGGSVGIARDAPKGCKFGVLVNAPDLANKRKQYLMNASSKDERNAWIEAIGRAVPRTKVSPKAPRKEAPPQRYSKDKLEAARPTYTARQDTANEAATSTLVHQEPEEETNIDEQVEPSITIRHDTANVAALAAAIKEEEEEEQVTNFDDELVLKALGPQLSHEHDSSDEGSSSDGVRSPTPLEMDERVEETVNKKGKMEVVTSVTVVTSEGDSEKESQGSSSPDSKPEENGLESPSSPPNERGERRSSEVTFPQEEQSLLVTVAIDDSDTSSSDEETSEPPSDLSEATPAPGSSEPSPVDSIPPIIKVENADTLKRQDATEVTENGEGSGKESGGSDNEKDVLVPSRLKQRRGSAPFFEKRGFLYKMGGRHKNWKLRYFVLQPGTFSYYKKDPRSKPLGEVKLKDLQIFFPRVGERKQSFQFTVHTESSWNKRPDWVLAAQSEKEMKEWITAFKLAGTKGPSPSPEREIDETPLVQNGLSNGGLATVSS